MAYFLLATSVLGQDPTRFTISGAQSVLQFGSHDDSIRLIRNATEDELVCSGKIKAADVLIEGTSTTVADLIGEVATLRQDVAETRGWLFFQRALTLKIRVDLDAALLRDALLHSQPFSTLPHSKWLDGSGKSKGMMRNVQHHAQLIQSSTPTPRCRICGSAGP